eukprot:3245467-Prymnesium_polylepis.2
MAASAHRAPLSSQRWQRSACRALSTRAVASCAQTARGGQGGTAISMVSPEGGDIDLLQQLVQSYGEGLHQVTQTRT